MVYILYNPLANNGRGSEGLDKVKAAARSRADGREPVMVDVTKQSAGAFLLALPASDEAILCGGDGTLHFLINALDGAVPTAPVWLWRMGTGNDFLRDVAGRKDTGPVLLNRYIAALPQAEVNGTAFRFINNVSFGLDGQVCELGEQEKARLGRRVNYVPLAIRLAAGGYALTNADVTVDGETRHYEKVWVASAFNGRFVGGGLKLAPGQDRNSDKLCCVVWSGKGRVYTLLNLARVLWGGHVKLPNCDVRFGHDISVTFDRPTALNMDGEVISGVTSYQAHK